MIASYDRRSLKRVFGLISQKDSGYADCVPIAICNGLRLLGRRTPRPRTVAWEKVVDIAGCRYGTSTNVHSIAKHLGAKLVRIRDVTANCPIIVTVWNPESGSALHAVTTIYANAQTAVVINYRSRGPLIELLAWTNEDKLPRTMAGFVDRRRFGDRLYLFRRSPIYKVVAA